MDWLDGVIWVGVVALVIAAFESPIRAADSEKENKDGQS